MAEDSFTQRGGITVADAFYRLEATWPFASIRVEESQLIIRAPFKQWIIPKESIRRLGKRGLLFRTGLDIQHSIDAYSRIIVFWAGRFARLKVELENRGYELDF